ncbi:MurR/RpiR family transcriptional regulator [Roseibium sp. M-1]
MLRPTLSEQIIACFDGFPKELKKAAQFVIDNPSDVALLSMREQARRAGVQASTMTRLAKQLGLEGYDAVREAYAEALRFPVSDFAEKARGQRRRQALDGDQALAGNIIASLKRQIDALGSPERLAQLTEAAALIVKARRVFCVGLRASYPIVWQLHYILSLIGEKTVMLDDVADTGADRLRFATQDDVLFAVTVRPYTRVTLDIADYAHRRGTPVIALTDSAVSPLARNASVTVLASTESSSFFHTMTPAFALAEILAGLVAGREGDEALEALRRADDYHASLGTYATTRPIPVAPISKDLP